MARIPVLHLVAEQLENSGRNSAEIIIGLTYRALAARVYGVEPPGEPSPAQLSAVRRAVAKLVAEGRAKVDGERLMIPSRGRSTYRDTITSGAASGARATTSTRTRAAWSCAACPTQRIGQRATHGCAPTATSFALG